MQVFLGWSGRRSLYTAQALYDWLPYVLQGVEPWMVMPDAGPAARWNAEVASRLDASAFGVLCLTRDALSEPWTCFEAGVLAKSLGTSRVCTYLLDLDPIEVQEPFGLFAACTTGKESSWKLVLAMYRALDGPGLREARLRKVFDKFWPDLEEALHRIPEERDGPRTRSHRSLLEEILHTVRGLSQVSHALIETLHDESPQLRSLVKDWTPTDPVYVEAAPTYDDEEPNEWVFEEEDVRAEVGGDGRDHVHDPEEVVGVEEVTPPAPLLSGLTKPKILVVEDNEDTQYLIQSLLEDEATIAVVASAEEALLEAFRDEYAMVILDINLGEGPNGVDLLTELRAMPSYREVPIVAITAYALPGDKERFLKMGFTDYLSKPFLAKELMVLMDLL